MWDNHNESIQNTSGGYLDDSHGSVSGGDKDKQGQNVIPVMIKHLTSSPGELTLWGEPVHAVTFVGIVRRIEQATTKTTFEIEDETDRITGLRWLGGEKITSQCHVELNTYVRVHGYLREQSGTRHVLILQISPLMDLNELTSHLLEVTYAMLKAESDIRDTAEESLVGFSKEQAIVFKIIQEHSCSVDGIERSVLKSQVPKSILSQVDHIVDFLLSEGHIYSTLTDDHLKTT